MRKLLFTFALTLLTTAGAWAYDFKAGDLYYNITDEAARTVEVTYEYRWSSSNYSSLSGAVTIPETVSYNSTTYSVTSIGDGAFYECSALTQVNIPNSVESIGYRAFYGCSALAQVTIGDGVTSIGNEAFYETALYNNADNWTNNVLYIDNCLIKAKTELSGSYEIATGTRVIADGAFEGCSKLTQVNIPSSVTSIGNSAFRYCSALTQVTISDGVTSIGNRAFEGCSKLTQVNIPSSVTSIGNSAFRYCSALTQVTISDGVTSIGNRAFYGCSALRQITIPDGVTSIGDYAFCNCSALRQMNIPDSVTSIGEATFGGCSALKQVTLPESVTSIGDYAFSDCSALTQVTIGNSVTSIGHYAFSGCSALAEMTVLATVPPTIGGASTFYNVSRSIPVYVPAEALEDYWVAEVWEEFYYLQAMPANALHTPAMPESISVYGGMLHNPQQLPVSLYDIQGRMVYSGTAATVSQPAGVYVVRCAGASGKVLF